jgi:hypothetical protein
VEDDSPIVALVDEEGVERDFRLHDAFEVDGGSYYLVEAVEGEDEVLLLRETADGLATVEGDEFERVMAILEEDAEAEEPE